MELSSDILGWINDNYDKSNNINDFVKVKDVYAKFKNSEFYNNLSKMGKREYTETTFINKLKENYFF